MKIRVNGKTVEVDRKHYVTAKTKQLREFGYSNLTEAEVNKQIDEILKGGELGREVNVIGGFMLEEVRLEPIPTEPKKKARKK